MPFSPDVCARGSARHTRSLYAESGAALWHILHDTAPDFSVAGSALLSQFLPPVRLVGCLALAGQWCQRGQPFGRAARTGISVLSPFTHWPRTSFRQSFMPSVIHMFSAGCSGSTFSRFSLISAEVAFNIIYIVICFILKHMYDDFKTLKMILLLTRESTCL